MNEDRVLDQYTSQRGNPRAPVPLRDLILLPFLSLATIALLWNALEFTAGKVLRRSQTSIWSCLVGGDTSATVVRGVPNSVCWEKMPESPLVEYRFNTCGHRSVATCGPKQAETLRVVLIGSSFVMGYQVPYEQTFALLLERNLSALTGRKVEVDNQAMVWGTPHSVDIRFEEALDAKPDLILWAVTPWDVEHVLPKHPVTIRSKGPWERLSNAYHEHRIGDVLYNRLAASRSFLLLQHWLYLNQSQYVRNYLMQTDVSGFLGKEPSPEWRARWKEFDNYARDLALRSNTAGVPFAVTAVPDRAEASLISARDWPLDVDPFAFGRRVRSAAESHGCVYLDLLPAFRNVPAAGRLYYPVDGHVNSNGDALIARLLADRLTNGIFPSLKKDEAELPAGRGSH